MILAGLPYKLIAAFLALAGVFLLGWNTKGHRDELEAIQDANKAALVDAARVTKIDLGTEKIQTTFHVELQVIRTEQAKNVEEQDNAITQDPSLAQCQLPADLVRLRGEQATASEALSGTSPVTGNAGPVPAAGSNGVQ